MLTDNQIRLLKRDSEFKKVTKLGLKTILSDLEPDELEFKPDPSIIFKYLSTVYRNRIIKSEICHASTSLILNLINIELQWPRTPDEVEVICCSGVNNYKWMRFDEPRIKVLFRNCKIIISTPEFRDLVKEYSTIGNDELKNRRLLELRNDLEVLEENTLNSLDIDDLWENWIKLNSRVHYKKYKKDMIKAVLEKATSNVPFPMLTDNVREEDE